MKRKYTVSNMMCASCVSHVKKAAEKVKGVEAVDVNLLTESMNVIFDEKITNDDEIMQSVINEGYGCEIFKRKLNMENIANLKKIKIRIVISFIFMMLLMFVAMAHMVKIPLPFGLDDAKNSLWFAILQIILVIPILILNRSYFISGFKKLFTLKPNMDSLIAIGAFVSVAYGIFATIMIALNKDNLELVLKYRHDMYFESAGTILTLITIGKYLEQRSKKKTTESLEKIMALTPTFAILVKDEQEIEIPIEKVMTNDILKVKAGMTIPVDGEIIKGSGAINESIVTGESIPLDKVKGDKVIAGSINLSGHFLMQAKTVAGETTIDKILDLVEEASSSKAKVSRLADKIASIFVPTVILIALITGIIWLIFKNEQMALNSFISVLVISCPCSLGLATPVAIMVATGKAAELNILVKSAEALEQSHKITKIFLDKTGTITQGEMTVASINTKMDEDEFLKIVALIESTSLHPLSKSILNYCKNKNIAFDTNDESSVLPGLGIMAKYKGITYYAGNSKLMKSLNIIENLDALVKEHFQNGETVIYFAKENDYLGYVSLKDKIRENASSAVCEFLQKKLEVIMITGDSRETALAIANEVGITEVYASVKPDEKAQIITKLKTPKDVTSFVGDGINDAVALTCADVGIAIGAGSDVATSSADIVLPHNDLNSINCLIDLSRKTINNIKMNLFWAFFYNSVGIIIATGIFYNNFGLKLNPMIASLAMSLSSFCVVMNALRLRFFRRKK